MSTPAGDSYVALQIATLADGGTSASELLTMLPEETLISAMRALADAGGTGAAEGHLLRCATVRRVLRVELDSR